MKSKVKTFVSILVVLTLVVGCFAALLQTTNAADDSVYKITAWVNNTGSINVVQYEDGSSAAVTSTLMQLVDQYGNVIYALCVNQKVTTYLGVEYKMVDLNDYPGLDVTQKNQILALLNYVSINYGLDTAKGIALAQTVIWRIIHPDIQTIIPQNNVGITQKDIDEVFEHRNDLYEAYNVDITLQGTANKTSQDTTYSYYGPFSVSYNYALADIAFNLTFTQETDAIFTDATHTKITQTTPGTAFYIGVPHSTTQTTFNFNATASKGVNLITGMKFLVSTSGTNQPLVVYQPLVQPLVNPEAKLYHYSCNSSFTIAAPKVNVSLAKTVDGINFNVWLSGYTNAQQTEILNGMRFELYQANHDCTAPIGNSIAQCKLDGLTGRIEFGELTLEAGWYAIVEVLTGKAAEIFEQPEPMYLYISNRNIMSSISQTNVDGTFTIQHTGGYALPIKLIGDGIAYDMPTKPDGSGQQLSTERFDTTLPDGTQVPSFCADLGAHNIFGNYKFDVSNHGFSDADMLNLIAALDYINDKVGSIKDDFYGKAVAQIVVWNMILQVDGNAGYADSWFNWEIQKIEGTAWYATYSSMVDDILSNPAKYTNLYNTKLAAPIVEQYVSGAIFVVGNDQNYHPIDQQRQIVVLFGSKASYPAFDNKEQEITTGSLTINAKAGTKVNIKDSITGGYHNEAIPDAKGKYDHTKYAHNLGIKVDANTWFQFNEFTTGTSQHFDLVQGDKLNLVGGYTINYNPITKEYTITLDDALTATGAKLSISNTILAAKNKNDKNYNINNIWTHSPGQQQFSFDGHSYTFKASWVDCSKKVYVYIHLEGLTGYANNNGVNIGDTYTVNVINKDNNIAASKTMTMTSGTTSIIGSVTFDNLEHGQYTVEVVGPKGTKLLYVEVEANKTTTVDLW
ncbi:MAG: hypothetical protein FWC74_05340 [Candidatus Bathyarchaeota archaeon]|nr:hypothetical protein [Candidatus Termitimicrobium sp.]